LKLIRSVALKREVDRDAVVVAVVDRDRVDEKPPQVRVDVRNRVLGRRVRHVAGYDAALIQVLRRLGRRQHARAGSDKLRE
jgi:hypothetical protein